MKAVIGFDGIKELIKTDKGIKMILAAGAVLIAILALWSLFGGKSAEKTSDVSCANMQSYEHELENRLAKILSGIDGVGEVSVMVTLDSSEKTEYGKNADMLLSVTAPEVRGVIVVCDGGDSVTVKEKVVNAVTGVFGISTTHVSVTR